jgi:pimeloyl-ACP methyl ester carboxylesterase
VRPDDQVTIVGHSQGGVIAVNTARDAVASGGFHVTNVITVGSPISSVVAQLPLSVDVLAIENDGDLVPHLDGAANPDQGNVTTVTVHHNQHDVVSNHDLTASYLPAAAEIEASSDVSVQAYLATLAGTFSASSVTTYTYVVTRTVT